MPFGIDPDNIIYRNPYGWVQRIVSLLATTCTLLLFIAHSYKVIEFTSGKACNCCLSDKNKDIARSRSISRSASIRPGKKGTQYLRLCVHIFTLLSILSYSVMGSNVVLRMYYLYFILKYLINNM